MYYDAIGGRCIMTISLGGKMIILYLTIGVILAAAGVDNTLSNTLTNGEGGINDNLADTLPNVNEETGAASGILAFIDSLKAVRQFLIFFGTVSIALPALLLDLALPEIIRLLVGIPLTTMAIIGLVQFGRNGQ